MASCTSKQPSLRVALAIAGTAAAGGVVAWWLWSQRRKALSEQNLRVQAGQPKPKVNPANITDFYDVLPQLLGGDYTRKVQDKSSKAVHELKRISKAHVRSSERFNSEIAIMQKMDHPNIIKLIDNFEDGKAAYLVIELFTGGELFDRIIDSGRFTEVQAAIVMKQVLQSVEYMHDMGVCHRDLKPENFKFVTQEPVEKSLMKLSDLSLACFYTPCSDAGPTFTTKTGTPYYVAPQVLAGKYDQKCDLWSCGVMTYALICGYPPFFGETDAEVLSKVRLGNFSFNAADWKHVSEDSKNLIRMLLKMNPRDRYDAKQALNSAWIEKKHPKAANVLD